ncbi:hypothetical protein L2E82_49175 [Cichorium intybus]|uniref:Uncharacterized protein n=1 Tax=Cichorium intybus TaxID=13427 RepID=A0ACB8YZK2_CICIN|nr:hypothetical protein L2E82_49175 [Cichorium intybus]
MFNENLFGNYRAMSVRDFKAEGPKYEIRTLETSESSHPNSLHNQIDRSYFFTSGDVYPLLLFIHQLILRMYL